MLEYPKDYRVHIALDVRAEDEEDAKNIVMLALIAGLKATKTLDTGLLSYRISGTPVDLAKRNAEKRNRGVWKPQERDELRGWIKLIEEHIT
jgi:hypothetical protein